MPPAQLQTSPDLLCSIPPELLVLIFEHNVGAIPALNSHLIRVTHVCRYWRDVALHSPTLWTHIALRKRLDAVRACLRRSRGLPLCIFISLTSFPSYKKEMSLHALRVLLAECGRIRSLKVSLQQHAYAYYVVMKSIASIGAPQLQKLWFERLPPYYEYPYRRPSALNDMLRLRSLTIAGEFLPWLPGRPDVLTEIDMTSALHDVHTLLDLLERSPALQWVTIRGSFNHLATRAARRVVLARLKSLRMQSYPLRGITALLPSLVLPSAHTNVALVCPQQEQDAFADLVPAYAGADPLRFAVLENLARVELWWGRRGDQVFRAYRSGESGRVDDRAAAALEVMVNSNVPSNDRFFGDWPLDASHVKTVVIYGKYAILEDPTRWRAMLATVLALKTLRVTVGGEDMLNGLIFGLAPMPGPLCLQLTTLTVKEVSLSSASWEALMDAIASRFPAAGGCLSNGPAPWDESTSSRIRKAGVMLVVTTPH